MNNLRYLSPKSPFSERGLAIALLKKCTFYLLYVDRTFYLAKAGGVFYNTLVIKNAITGGVSALPIKLIFKFQLPYSPGSFTLIAVAVKALSINSLSLLYSAFLQNNRKASY
jgi:hypothetical protein